MIRNIALRLLAPPAYWLGFAIGWIGLKLFNKNPLV